MQACHIAIGALSNLGVGEFQWHLCKCKCRIFTTQFYTVQFGLLPLTSTRVLESEIWKLGSKICSTQFRNKLLTWRSNYLVVFLRKFAFGEASKHNTEFANEFLELEFSTYVWAKWFSISLN